MRSPVAAAAAVVVLAGLGGLARPATADATLVKGGPRADRGRVDAALGEATAAMGVCWRGKPPAKVRVKLDVMRDGAVNAAAVDKSAAAQCAAGVLAVWTLPGGTWSGEVEITAGAAEQDLATAIQQGLLARSASIKACQSKAPAAAGPVGIKMKIHPDGSITDIAVTSTLGAAIDGCVAKAVAAIHLDGLSARAPVSYALAVAFAGKGDAGGGGGTGPVAPPDEPGGGNVEGQLTVEQVKTVMSAARSKLLACGKKGKAKGVAVTRFTIRPDGSTKNVVVKEPIGDAAIEGCLVGVYKSLKFPTASAETKVSYPVAFR